MIYLDNAATTFPKPLCVSKEIANCINNYCGNPGRSGHKMSVKAAEKLYECREEISSFFGCNKPENVVFTLNTTYALNLAIKTLCEPKTHVLISNMEHNSVFRTINELESSNGITYSFFNLLQDKEKILNELEKIRRENTKMLIMPHASNIIGYIFPIEAIGKFCKKHEITFIVDAAQSAGNVNINMEKCNIGAICAPAHKGLYGPQGLGFVVFGNALPKRPFIIGGNGVNSLSANMGTELPESFEAGTMPTPLVAGLCASVKWIKDIGIEKINKHEVFLAKRLIENLKEIKGCLIFGDSTPQSGIVLFKSSRIATDAISYHLDKMNICTRGGFHCSPLAHNALGTGEDGAIRISIGFFNTLKDIETVSNEIFKICR